MKARPLMGATMAVTCTLLIAVAFRLSPLGHAASTRRTEMDGLNAAALIPTLHRMNEIEIDAGRMAQSNSASEAVKDYGRQLEQDHQAADQDLEAFAQARSVSIGGRVPTNVQIVLEHAEQRMAGLRAKRGSEFDGAFARAMKQEDKTTIEIVDQSRPRIIDARLEMLLGQLVAMLQAQKKAASSILADMNAQQPGSSTEPKPAFSARAVK